MKERVRNHPRFEKGAFELRPRGISLRVLAACSWAPLSRHEKASNYTNKNKNNDNNDVARSETAPGKTKLHNFGHGGALHYNRSSSNYNKEAKAGGVLALGSPFRGALSVLQ
jgi:hypothetical protein